MNQQKLIELKKLAEAATLGPWKYVGNTGVDFDCVECGEEFPESGYAVKSEDKHARMECHLYGLEIFAKPDGLFIAALNPQTVLELLGEVEKLREALRFIAGMEIEVKIESGGSRGIRRIVAPQSVARTALGEGK